MEPLIKFNTLSVGKGTRHVTRWSGLFTTYRSFKLPDIGAAEIVGGNRLSHATSNPRISAKRKNKKWKKGKRGMR